MKNLKMQFTALLEDARLVNGKKSDYIALNIKQGYNRYSTYTKDLTVIDLMPGEYLFNVKINEFNGKLSMEVITVTK